MLEVLFCCEVLTSVFFVELFALPLVPVLEVGSSVPSLRDPILFHLVS